MRSPVEPQETTFNLSLYARFQRSDIITQQMDVNVSPRECNRLVVLNLLADSSR